MRTEQEYDPLSRLGTRLKNNRLKSKKSLREMAREFNVSATFLSQIENGKSRPSVATLYSIARVLNVNIDLLLCPSEGTEIGDSPLAAEASGNKEKIKGLSNIWDHSYARISTVNPDSRRIFTTDSGIQWERLAANQSRINFMEIIYQPGAETDPNGEAISHEGYEYGYALEGNLEVTVGDLVFILTQSHSIGFDSSIPHKFKNLGTTDFRGIWFVHNCGSVIQH